MDSGGTTLVSSTFTNDNIPLDHSKEETKLENDQGHSSLIDLEQRDQNAFVIETNNRAKTQIILTKDQENSKPENDKFAKMKERIQKRESEREKLKQLKKAPIQTKPEDNEVEKIQTYFRYRVATLTKIIEERVKNNGLLNKVGTKSSKKEEAPSNQGNDALKDEVWKNIRRFCSTKSKYKYRDFVNFEKKVLNAIKTLTNKKTTKTSSSTKQTPLTLELHDEHSTINQPKEDADAQKIIEARRTEAENQVAILKKQNPSAKFFVVNNIYPDLKAALLKRGWIENPEQTSNVFNLKWVLKKQDIEYTALTPHQSVNHFENNNSITTKAGLARNIRNLIWFENDDIDNIYPRCYDLNDVQEFEDFLEDFKFGEAIAILRLVEKVNDLAETKQEDIQFLKFKLCVALSVCERRLKPIEKTVELIMKGKSTVVSLEEWNVMTSEKGKDILGNTKFDALKQFVGDRYKSQFKESNLEEEKTLLEKAKATLNKIELNFPQNKMNQGRNVWIIKPAGMSRGRGIRCYDNLTEIFDHIRVKESEWIAQKYIENPLIIKNKKFDIRQWVLVTDWEPLTIWFYQECYVRFTAQSFDPNDLANKFAHLTNNSISKKMESCETSEIEGNMWFLDEFKTYLNSTFDEKDLFEKKIQPQMQNIVIKSLQSVQDMIETRKNSFELYGYDFMIDENCNPWLIEINSSPTMEYSTTVTQKLVKMVMEDCVKVIVDYGKSKPQDRKNVSTGCFSCIHPKK
jgi:tubulin monoglycylase TTLL3/8